MTKVQISNMPYGAIYDELLSQDDQVVKELVYSYEQLSSLILIMLGGLIACTDIFYIYKTPAFWVGCFALGIIWLCLTKLFSKFFVTHSKAFRKHVEGK